MCGKLYARLYREKKKETHVLFPYPISYMSYICVCNIITIKSITHTEFSFTLSVYYVSNSIKCCRLSVIYMCVCVVTLLNPNFQYIVFIFFFLSCCFFFLPFFILFTDLLQMLNVIY